MFQGAGEGAEFGDREFLGAHGWQDAGAREQGLQRDAERLEACPQHLAALAEGDGCDALERRPLRRCKWFGAGPDRDQA